MNYHLIFDVDGTLTPSRGIIDKEFHAWFMTYIDSPNIKVSLVTGSDYPKTCEQLGEYFLQLPFAVYNCSGNEKRQSGKIVSSRYWDVPKGALNYLARTLDQSAFPIRTGNHIELRRGMLNFSVVGRNATIQDRAKYVAWDEQYDERDLIAHNFNRLFPGLQANIGGLTGIDIHPKGWDKSQIASELDLLDDIHFFGDAIYPGGNDYLLAIKIAELGGTVHHVKDWKQTWNILKEIV